MDDKTPAAPAPAPAGESVANTPTNTNNNEAAAEGISKTETATGTQSSSVDLHGFTPEQLGEMKKFFDNNGGFEKIKSKISNPEKVEDKAAIAQPAQQPQAQPAVAQNNSDILSPTAMAMENYFARLSEKEEYAGIKNDIQSGKILNEMISMGMRPLTEDGSVNIKQVNMFLDLKAKSVPAPQPSVTPEASPAPTVNYTQVGENISSREEALRVLQESAIASQSGNAPHPAYEKAKAYLKENPLGKR